MAAVDDMRDDEIRHNLTAENPWWGAVAAHQDPAAIQDRYTK
jgi:hypothetical protein